MSSGLLAEFSKSSSSVYSEEVGDAILGVLHTFSINISNLVIWAAEVKSPCSKYFLVQSLPLRAICCQFQHSNLLPFVKDILSVFELPPHSPGLMQSHGQIANTVIPGTFCAHYYFRTLLYFPQGEFQSSY